MQHGVSLSSSTVRRRLIESNLNGGIARKASTYCKSQGETLPIDKIPKNKIWELDCRTRNIKMGAV